MAYWWLCGCSGALTLLPASQRAVSVKNESENYLWTPLHWTRVRKEVLPDECGYGEVLVRTIKWRSYLLASSRGFQPWTDAEKYNLTDLQLFWHHSWVESIAEIVMRQCLNANIRTEKWMFELEKWMKKMRGLRSFLEVSSPKIGHWNFEIDVGSHFSSIGQAVLEAVFHVL